MYGSATACIGRADWVLVVTPPSLQGVLQGQAVDNRSDHSGVIRRRTIHALPFRGRAAPYVAPSHDYRNFHAAGLGVYDLVRDVGDGFGADCFSPRTLQ